MSDVWDKLTTAEKAELDRLLGSGWPLVYVNSETGSIYTPHHNRERDAVYNDTIRYTLFRGGEGSGKTTAGVVKTLNRLRRGCNGAMVSPDFEHLKKSLWPEFRRWCPWQRVIEKHRYRQSIDWTPSGTFELVFDNAIGGQSVLICGGAKESEIGSWEGPNLNFVHLDEMRRHKLPVALKVFDGRVRIPGPNGELPQLWLTTTPRKHWLFDYFGPLQEKDKFADFKRDALDVLLLTTENANHLSHDFVKQRAQTLTAAEARVLLNAEWEDIEDAQRFLPSMVWWDDCREDLPQLTQYEPMVLALDAATGRVDGQSDCFAIVGITRHPADNERVAVRFVQTWQARAGGKIDFQGDEDNPGPELVVRQLCERFNVLCVVYDPAQLHDMANRLGKEGVAWFNEFPQGAMRLEADRALLDLITQKRIAHDGNETLREHIDNADRKTDEDGHRLRIVKRVESEKIDGAVCTSMAAYKILRLNL